MGKHDKLASSASHLRRRVLAREIRKAYLIPDIAARELALGVADYAQAGAKLLTSDTTHTAAAPARPAWERSMDLILLAALPNYDENGARLRVATPLVG